MVVPTYLPATRYGGPIESVHGLSRGLVSRGHDVRVFTTNIDGPGVSNVPLDQVVELDGVGVRYFPSRRPKRIYRSTEMDSALRKELSSFDLVHAHSIYLWPTFAAARHADDTEVPLVISPRGMLVRSLVEQKSRLIKTLWLRLVEKGNFSRASAIHFTSRREMTDARQFSLALPRPFVVPNGIESDAPMTEKTSYTARREPVLFLGRISWKKRIDQLLRAMVSVPGVPLIVAGNDEENLIPSLEALSRELGIDDRVSFPGWADNETKWRLLREASVLVLPSLSENFGNVILEAMAAGAPIITTPEVGAAEIVQAENAGLVVKGTAQSIATAIASVLDRPELARRMGESGARAAREHYSWEDIAARMEERYAAIIADHSRQRPADNGPASRRAG
ncbi:MAG: glycosyltransferase [Acidobacteria bacterium]|nr:glycosyltransferase [Acidobacteriota bacterium]